MESTDEQLPRRRDSFKHTPLNHSEPSIRLVQILPQESLDGLIQCRISHATVNASYHCLSYRWGLPTTAHTILIDDKPYYVRENLFNFLSIARHKPTYTSLLLWVDALCIDQENTTERNHQVQQMGKIFSQAEGVLLWLGKHDFLPHVLRIFRKARDPDFEDWSVIRSQKDMIAKHLFNNDYWSRAWVTQEIVLAREVTAMLDTEEIPLSQLIKVQRSFYLDSWDGSPFAQFEVKGSGFVGASLLTLLSHFRDKQCHVPRDRIFSLLSLCGEGSDIEVDYSISAIDLMARVLDHCKDSLCICSAALVAQSLGIYAEYLQGVISPLHRAYIEFDVSSYNHRDSQSDRIWRALSGEEYRWPGTGSEFGFLYSYRDTCTSDLISLCWKRPKNPGETTYIYSAEIAKDGADIQLGTFGKGVEIFRKGDEKDICVVRLALWLLAKLVKDPVVLCPRIEARIAYKDKVSTRLGYWKE